MPSRYDEFQLNSGVYVPQYAGSPLDTVTKTNEALEDRHYRNLADLSNLQLLRQQYESKVLPGAKGYIKDQFGDIDQTLKDITANGAENSTAKIAALKNKFLGDQAVLAAMQHAQGYEEFKKTKNALTAQGHTPLWDTDLEQRYLNEAPIDEEGKLSSLYEQPFNLTPEARLGYLEKQDKVVDPLTADRFQSDLTQAWTNAKQKGLSQADFLQSNEYRQLTKGKVNQYLFGKSIDPVTGKVVNGLGWESYKSTPEYQQQMKYAKALGLTEDDIKEQLRSRGEAKVFNEVQKQFIRNPDADKEPSGQGNIPFSLQASTLNPAKVQEAYKLDLPWNFSSIDSPIREHAQGLAEVNKDYTKTKEGQKIHKNLVNATKAAIEAYGIDLGTTGGDWTGGGGLGKREVTDKDVEKYATTPEGEKLVKKFMQDFQSPELVNSYGAPAPDAKSQKEIERLIQSNARNLSYYDPKTGKKVEMYENGELNDKWKTVTGGKPETFTYGNTHSILNANAGAIGEDDAASNLHSISGKDEKGYPVSFLVSNPADVNPININTNIIFHKGLKQPGIFFPLKGAGEARFLVGNQKLNVLVNQLKSNPQLKNLSPDQITNIAKNQLAELGDIPLYEYKKGNDSELVDAEALAEKLLTAENNYTRLSYKDKED